MDINRTKVFVEFETLYAVFVVGDRQDLRREIQSLAFRQAGYFTAAQALQVGYSYQAQKYHVDHGNWLRVDRALFRLPGWPTATEDTFVRWTLWSRGHGVVSHDTALLVHELSDLDPARVHLTVNPGFTPRDAALSIHVAAVPEPDLEQRDGWRVTAPLRTLLDAAASDTSQEHIDSAVATAVSRGLVSVRRLRSRSDAFGDRAALRIERALSLVSRS